MQTVKISLADNGVIKIVSDDNINSGGESYESTTVYVFDDTCDKIKFLEELSVDIGLSFGNSKSKERIRIKTEWGTDYVPSSVEINEKIGQLNSHINLLKGMLDG